MTDPDLAAANEIAKWVLEHIVEDSMSSRAYGILQEKTAQALKEARKRQAEADALLAEKYDAYKEFCGDTTHDPRWCGHCESRNDGAAEIAAKIRESVK